MKVIDLYCVLQSKMAEHADLPAVEDKDEETPGYKPPAEMPVSRILEMDAEDESLRKYKEALLGGSNVDKIVLCMLLHYVICLTTINTYL